MWLLSGHKPSVFRGLSTYPLPKPVPRGHGCQYGKRAQKAVRDAYWKLGWPVWFVNSARATRYGPVLHAVLLGKQQRPLSYRITAGKRAWRAAQKPKPPPLDAKVQRLVDTARYLIRHANLVHYSQRTRMQIVRYRLRIPPLLRRIWEDCSSSITGLYWLAGLADPNGLGYNGFGYTGTQSNQGRPSWRAGQSLSRLKPGDLIFYGRWPHKHVTLYLGGGLVYSHGTERGPYLLPALYRTDAVYAHRYF